LQHVVDVEKHENKLRDCLKGVHDLIKSKGEVYNDLDDEQGPYSSLLV
jgi:hypothetical protein